MVRRAGDRPGSPQNKVQASLTHDDDGDDGGGDHDDHHDTRIENDAGGRCERERQGRKLHSCLPVSSTASQLSLSDNLIGAVLVHSYSKTPSPPLFV